jgi:hypothetical protein
MRRRRIIKRSSKRIFNGEYVGIPFIVTLMTFAMQSCGTRNLGNCPGASPLVSCTDPNKDESIRIALDRGDLSQARILLEEAIGNAPDNYNRYPLLSAVYAGLAGFRLINAISATGSSTDSSSITSAMEAFLPDPSTMTRTDYDAKFDLMGLAVSTLQAIPADFVANAASDKYAHSANQQLPLYLAAKAVMYMKIFTFNFETGVSDPGQLANLSAADADTIIALLSAAAAGGGSFGSIAASTLDTINSGGGNNRDNLANFLGNQ